MAESFAYDEKENSLGIAESRVHSRTEVRALAYIELSDENAGLILNISEDGLAVQAVQVVTSDHLPRMRFRLPKTDRTIEVAGRMVWQLRSRKEVGIQFVDLSDAARAHIHEWIAAEPSRLAAPLEPPRRRTLQPDKPSRPEPGRIRTCGFDTCNRGHGASGTGRLRFAKFGSAESGRAAFTRRRSHVERFARRNFSAVGGIRSPARASRHASPAGFGFISSRAHVRSGFAARRAAPLAGCAAKRSPGARSQYAGLEGTHGSREDQ